MKLFIINQKSFNLEAVKIIFKMNVKVKGKRKPKKVTRYDLK